MLDYIMSCYSKLCPDMLSSLQSYVTSVCQMCYVSLLCTDDTQHIVFVSNTRVHTKQIFNLLHYSKMYIYFISKLTTIHFDPSRQISIIRHEFITD